MMLNKSSNIRILFLLFLITVFAKPLFAFNTDPRNTCRYETTANILVFISVSDTHVDMIGSEKNLRLLFDSCLNVINPAIVVNTGDLTDARVKACDTCNYDNLLPSTQQKDEWLKYESIFIDRNTSNYFDVPGNHDRHGDTAWLGLYDSTDSTLFGYTRNSVLGENYWNDTTIPVGQFAKTITLDSSNDNYLFIGANTCDTTGVEYTLWWALTKRVSDYPELDSVERKYIKDELDEFYPPIKIPQNKLTFIFGHAGIYRMVSGWNPLNWLEYALNEIGGKRGGAEFAGLLNQYHVSAYFFGHTHKNRNFYDLNSDHNISSRLINTSSLTEQGEYRLIVVDNNGLSSRVCQLNKWPVVLITSPLDIKATGLDVSYDISSISNPYIYFLYQRADNFVRAISFDPSGIEKVEFKYKKISSSDWSNSVQMAKVFETSDIWQGNWDCSSLESGEYELAVRSVSKENKEDSHTITVKITNQDCILISPNGGEYLKGEFSIKAQINEEVLPRVELVEFLFSTDDKKTWQDAGSITGPFQDKNIEIPFDSKLHGIESARAWFKVVVWLRKL